MDISTNYKIVKFDEVIGQILVKFDEAEHLIPVDLHPNEEGHLLEGEVLDQYIRGFCPTEHIARKNTFANGIKNLDSIRALVQPLPEVPAVAQTVQGDGPILQPDEIQKLIESIKQQNGQTGS